MCPAQGVPEAGVGCDDWFGIFLMRQLDHAPSLLFLRAHPAPKAVPIGSPRAIPKPTLCIAAPSTMPKQRPKLAPTPTYFLFIKYLYLVPTLPNVEMIRAYGWRGGCPATGVTDAGVGSGDWFGIPLIIVQVLPMLRLHLSKG